MAEQILNVPIAIPCIEGEEWKIVPSWPSYAVSNKGRVYSLRNYVFMTPQKYKKDAKHLKVRLSDIGKWRGVFAHRLVAEAFIPNPENKRYVNHIDGNPKNNNVENLEWATPKENTQHSYRMGFQIMPTNRAIGDRRSKKLKTDDVIKIKELLSLGEMAMSAIGSMFNVTYDTIRAIRDGKSWSHIDGSIPSLIQAGIATKKEGGNG